MTENEKKLLQAKHRLEEAEMRDRQKERKRQTKGWIAEVKKTCENRTEKESEGATRSEKD